MEACRASTCRASTATATHAGSRACTRAASGLAMPGALTPLTSPHAVPPANSHQPHTTPNQPSTKKNHIAAHHVLVALGDQGLDDRGEVLPKLVYRGRHRVRLLQLLNLALHRLAVNLAAAGGAGRACTPLEQGARSGTKAVPWAGLASTWASLVSRCFCNLPCHPTAIRLTRRPSAAGSPAGELSPSR